MTGPLYETPETCKHERLEIIGHTEGPRFEADVFCRRCMIYVQVCGADDMSAARVRWLFDQRLENERRDRVTTAPKTAARRNDPGCEDLPLA